VTARLVRLLTCLKAVVLVIVGLIITKGPFSYSFNLVSKIRSVKGTITGASARTFDLSGTKTNQPGRK
jgi:hypothetical protein